MLNDGFRHAGRVCRQVSRNCDRKGPISRGTSSRRRSTCRSSLAHARSVYWLEASLLPALSQVTDLLLAGGVTPTNWRPLVSYGAYDQPHYVVDVTPFLPILLSNTSSTPHNITLRVKGQGLDGASFNSNWFVSGSVHVSLGSGPTSGKIVKYDAQPLQLQTTGGVHAGDQNVWTKVVASRSIRIESILKTGNGLSKRVVFAQKLDYSNDAKYEDEGWVQVS